MRAKLLAEYDLERYDCLMGMHTSLAVRVGELRVQTVWLTAKDGDDRSE